MRYVKLFEQYELESELNDYGIKNYSINSDGSIDVNDDVILSKPNRELDKIPFRFNIVNGNFRCFGLGLKTLENCPKEITGSFNCSSNGLESLLGGPSKVGKNYNASSNRLTNLDGIPDEISGDLTLSYNQLTNLDSLPAEISGDLMLSNNHYLKSPDIKSNIGGCLYLNECARLITLDYISPYYNEIDLFESQIEYFLAVDMPKKLFNRFGGSSDNDRKKIYTIFAKIWSNYTPVFDYLESDFNRHKLNLIYKDFDEATSNL